jgi:methylmalonyl-CoA mutase N-terminal domain/subunit
VVITCHTSGLSLTAQQPANNIVRGTLQAMALVLAGVDALEISAFDEAYRTPSPESHLVALRTQQIIHLESNVSKVADPLGGSYFVEALTNEIETRIRDMIKEIEAKGNPAELSDSGWFRKFFEERMDRYYSQISSGELPKVGVNSHVVPDHEDSLLRDVAELKIEPCWAHVERIKEFKRKRDGKRIERVLRNVYDKAQTEDENLIYPIIAAMESEASVGEIAGVLRMAYGFPYDPHGLMESPF